MPYSIWRVTICVRLAQQAVRGERITSAGIRYSNIEPDQEISAEPRADGVKRAAKMKPVRRADIAFRDGDEAGEARFGGEQVVAVGSRVPSAAR